MNVEDRAIRQNRPWPVYALIVLGAVAFILSLIFDSQRNLWDIPSGLLSLWFAYALWMGKRWAFTISFMCATLCAALMLLVAGIQFFLLEQQLHAIVLWGFLSSVVWIALLMHPATKRFAGLDAASLPQKEVTT